MERISWGKIQNPVRGLLHGSAALMSVVGLIILATVGVEATVKIALLVYGVSLVGLYTTSSLYHCVPWSETWKDRFQKLDHTWIYVLVAGTCTPLLVASLDGLWTWAGLLFIWGLTAMGAFREFWPRVRRRWSVYVQITLGALTLIPVALMLRAMEPAPRALTAIGSVVYLVGLVLFVNRRPLLFPRIFSHHEVWHVFVVTASIAHFLAVWQVAVAAPFV
ncbi:MAG TPA: hemolysin III family protein [Acidimicrobiia bacterium]|nr:hemolysin III family protein [Acidimicrobiia bacterium]